MEGNTTEINNYLFCTNGKYGYIYKHEGSIYIKKDNIYIILPFQSKIILVIHFCRPKNFKNYIFNSCRVPVVFLVCPRRVPL